MRGRHRSLPVALRRSSPSPSSSFLPLILLLLSLSLVSYIRCRNAMYPKEKDPADPSLLLFIVGKRVEQDDYERNAINATDQQPLYGSSIPETKLKAMGELNVRQKKAVSNRLLLLLLVMMTNLGATDPEARVQYDEQCSHGLCSPDSKKKKKKKKKNGGGGGRGGRGSGKGRGSFLGCFRSAATAAQHR